MAVAVRSFTATGGSGGSGTHNWTVTKPAGTSANDLMLALLVTDSDGAPTDLVAPAGWTKIGADNTTGMPGRIWYRVAGASEPASYTFTTNWNSDAVIHLITFTGVDPAAPIQVTPSWAGSATNSTTLTAPSLTATGPGGLVCLFASMNSGTFSTPTGMSEISDHDAGWSAAAVDLLVLTGSGATGSKASTHTVSQAWAAASLVLNAVSVAKSGSATATIRLDASRTGAKRGIGAPTATARLAASSTAAKATAGARTASLRLTAARTGGLQLVGEASATLRLDADADGQVINLATAVLRLTAALLAVARPGAGQVTATLTLDGSATSAPRATGGAATAQLRLTATRAGAGRKSGSPTAALLALDADAGGAKRGVGSPATAVLHLAGDSSGETRSTSGALSAVLRLTATTHARSRETTGVTRTATLRLITTRVATSTRAGAQTAVLRLTANLDSRRVISEISQAIQSRASLSVQYELVCMARIPQTTGPPLLLAVDPIDWTGLSYTDELSKPQQLQAGCQISGLTDAVVQRLRNLDELATELWLYRLGKLVFAGPLLGWQVQGETLTFNASGLLAYLKMMVIQQDLVFSQVDQFTMAHTMVDQWQNLDYGNFGIDTSTPSLSGVLRDGTYLQKELHNVQQRVTELGARQNGFDVSVDPSSRRFTLDYPIKGVDRSSGEDAIVFDDRNVTSPNIVASAAPGDVASEGYGTGTNSGAGGDTIFSVASNLELRSRYGRSAVTATFDGVSQQDTLDAYTQGLIDARGNVLLVPGPNVRVTPDSDLGGYDVGDTVSYQLHSRLSVAGAFRIRKRQVTVSKTGQESTSIQFV